MRGTLFIISGPSGVGKGTLVKMLLKEDDSLALSISCTTRAPRPGEVDGREYFFLSREEFLKRIAEGDFLEYDEHFSNFYGTPKSFVLKMLETKSVILEIDVEGGFTVRNALKNSDVKLVLIMVVPPDRRALVERLAKRASETEAERAERLTRGEYELGQIDEDDFVLVNDDLNEAKQQLLEFMQKEIEK